MRLSLSFIDSKVVYEYENKVRNKPAHEIAALGISESVGYHRVWLDEFPANGMATFHLQKGTRWRTKLVLIE
jgi:hypothetical protein